MKSMSKVLLVPNAHPHSAPPVPFKALLSFLAFLNLCERGVFDSLVFRILYLNPPCPL